VPELGWDAPQDDSGGVGGFAARFYTNLDAFALEKPPKTLKI
jgi:hypothetical protein